MYGLKHCSGCSSGTAAVHIALGALAVGPGREVITSSITDMGTLTGVLYQQLIPRFADIDPQTYNLDPAERGRSSSTRRPGPSSSCTTRACRRISRPSCGWRGTGTSP